MKKITLIVLVFLFSLHAFSQATWQWARSASGLGWDEGLGIVTDADGNVITAGGFSGPDITFGSALLINTNNNSDADIFVVKHNASGNLLWARGEGGMGNERGTGVASDGSGNIYVTGYFNSATMTIGATTLTNFNAGLNDIFIVKYDSSGSVLWARSAGGASWDGGVAIAADANGNIYVAGYFQSDSVLFGAATVTNAGAAQTDFFIVKYDSSGNALWAKSAGSLGGESGYGITVDGAGNVYAIGWFGFSSSPITIGTIMFTNPYPGSTEIFIVKYDSSGNVLWAKRATGNDLDKVYGITSDGGGHIYITGQFRSTSITFDSITLLNATNAGSYDMYVAQYDTAGNALWARRAGGINNEYAQSVSADGNGNVFVAGYFESSSIVFGASTLTNAGGNCGIVICSDIFVAKYNSIGNELWAGSSGGTSYDMGNSIYADGNGSGYITGLFGSTSISFGSNTITNSSTGYDMYIAKLNDITGITPQNNLQNSIDVFPNPATSEITVGGAGFNVERIEMWNVVGESLTPALSKGEGVRIDVSSLPAGIYFVAVTDAAGNRAVRKVVKM